MDERAGIFISVDMEGVAGIAHLHQVMRGSSEFERSCHWMTAEVNAAIAGARRAGVDRFLVNDSHGDMRNLLLDELDEKAEVVVGGDKPYSMGAGLDATYEAAFFIGYHAAIGTGMAVMDHSYGGRTIYALRINGHPQSETTLNAALAGTYGVRTSLITGDRTAVDEARRDVPGIEGVAVKEPLGRLAARTLNPAEACRRIEEGARRAAGNLGKAPVFTPKPPFAMEIDWMNTAMADSCEQIPGIERTGGRTICYRTDDYRSCYRMLLALLTMALPYAYQYPRP